MADTSHTDTLNFCPRIDFLGVVELKTPVPKNCCMCEIGHFLRCRYIYIFIYHAKSRLNTPVCGSLRSPNYAQFKIVQLIFAFD